MHVSGTFSFYYSCKKKAIPKDGDGSLISDNADASIIYTLLQPSAGKFCISAWNSLQTL